MKISIPVRKDSVHSEWSEELVLEVSDPLYDNVQLTVSNPLSIICPREQIEVSFSDLWRALRALKNVE